MRLDLSKFDEIIHTEEVTSEELQQNEGTLYIIDNVLYGRDISEIDFDAFTLENAEEALYEVFHHESEGESYEIHGGEVHVYGLHSDVNEVFRKAHLQQVVAESKKYKRKFI